MSFLNTLVAFIVALGALIVFHELGHFAVARLAGVKVLRFCVGFGRPIVSRRFGRDRTEWAIAALPLGGYVKMLDEREGPVEPAEVHRAFNRQNVWKRIAIVAAGPAANFLLAIAIYWVLFVGGVQEPKPIAGAPVPASIAAKAGVERGDLVRAVNGRPIATWQDLRFRVLELAVERTPIRLEVATARGHLETYELDLSDMDASSVEGDILAQLGMRLYRPDLPPVIGRVVASGAAERAGLVAGDRVVAINDEPIGSWDDLVATVRANPGATLAFSVRSGSAERRIEVVPERVSQGEETIGRIGAAPQVDPESVRGLTAEIRYGPLEAVGKAAARTWDLSIFSLRMLGKMVTGDLSWRNLSGPVTIADYAGQSAQLGLTPYLAFLALISISLGVLNLLPIPLLDGGHLMYYAVEVVKGSPLSERAMEFGQRVGLALLLILMAFAFYNDINRLLTG